MGDLAGAYNDIGVRRWFERQRTRLDGNTPAQALGGPLVARRRGAAARARSLPRPCVVPGNVIAFRHADPACSEGMYVFSQGIFLSGRGLLTDSVE